MRRAAALLGAIFLALALGACGNPQDHFPLWEVAEDVPEAADGASMEFVSVEPVELDEEYARWMKHFEPYDEWCAVHITLRFERETPAPSLYRWRIDFYHENAWHTVYRPKPQPQTAALRIYAPGEYDETYLVPAQVLEWPGKYRLCHTGTGECMIEIK